jgi:copper chaperone CopZ
MKQVLKVKGMHCHSCEILIEDKLNKVPGVTRVQASSKKAEVTISSDRVVSRKDMAVAVRAAGYDLGNTELPLVNINYRDLTYIVISFLVLGLLYLLISKTGLGRVFSFGSTGTPTSLVIIFTIGLTAGISSCMALVGGLVLGASTRYAEKHPEATPAQKFRPHLFFNLG